MFKFSYKLDVDGFRPFHVLIIRHLLLVDQPRADGRGYEITDETVIEIFTRQSEVMALEDAERRRGELMLEVA